MRRGVEAVAVRAVDALGTAWEAWEATRVKERATVAMTEVCGCFQKAVKIFEFLTVCVREKARKYCKDGANDKEKSRRRLKSSNF